MRLSDTAGSRAAANAPFADIENQELGHYRCLGRQESRRRQVPEVDHDL